MYLTELLYSLIQADNKTVRLFFNWFLKHIPHKCFVQHQPILDCFMSIVKCDQTKFDCLHYWQYYEEVRKQS